MTLADRIEQADGPSRELEAEIDWTDQALKGSPYVHNGLSDGDAGHWRDAIGLLHLAPHYTSSIDAAMTLMPEGREWGITADSKAGFAGLGLALVSVRTGIRSEKVWAEARTPALAICAAALRARETGDE